MFIKLNYILYCIQKCRAKIKYLLILLVYLVNKVYAPSSHHIYINRISNTFMLYQFRNISYLNDYTE